MLVSPSPHIHGSLSTRRLMLDVLVALLPSVIVAVRYCGLDVLMLVVYGVLFCVATEYVIQRFVMKRPSSVGDLSAAVTGVLLALNLPASAPWWIVLTGAVVAIGVAKMTFGGLGQNLFNPALVARVFLLVSFPVIMTDFSSVEYHGVDAVTGATPLALVNEGLAAGKTLPEIFAENDFSYVEMLFVRVGGSAGEVSAFALLLGFVYLLARRVIRPHVPLAVILTVMAFSGILWLVNPDVYPDPLFSVLTGGVLLGAIFMATDYVTSPMSARGMVIYGVGIGVLTVLIRNFGSYPEGISFAILIMNAVVPLINKYVKPVRFAKEVRKNG